MTSLQDLPDTFPALSPPKCVILFGDGFFSSSSSSFAHPNLDKLTADGCVGALMIRNGDASGRALREFAQFLSLHDSLYELDGKPKYELSDGKIKDPATSFPKQNFNLQTHLITSSPQIYHFCENLSFSGLSSVSSNFAELKSESVLKQITNILFSAQNEKKESKLDNVVVHLQADNPQSAENGIKIFDELVSLLRKNYEDLFIIVVTGFGDNTNVNLPFSKPEDKAGNLYPKIAHIIPPQSYITWNSHTLSIRESSPLFAVYYHRYFTRKDNTTIFNQEEFAIKNGNGKMPVDAFFPEVAFKQGKMPKYGA